MSSSSFPKSLILPDPKSCQSQKGQLSVAQHCASLNERVCSFLTTPHPTGLLVAEEIAAEQRENLFLPCLSICIPSTGAPSFAPVTVVLLEFDFEFPQSPPRLCDPSSQHITLIKAIDHIDNTWALVPRSRDSIFAYLPALLAALSIPLHSHLTFQLLLPHPRRQINRYFDSLMFCLHPDYSTLPQCFPLRQVMRFLIEDVTHLLDFSSFQTSQPIHDDDDDSQASSDPLHRYRSIFLNGGPSNSQSLLRQLPVWIHTENVLSLSEASCLLRFICLQVIPGLIQQNQQPASEFWISLLHQYLDSPGNNLSLVENLLKIDLGSQPPLPLIAFGSMAEAYKFLLAYSVSVRRFCVTFSYVNARLTPIIQRVAVILSPEITTSALPSILSFDPLYLRLCSRLESLKQ